MNDSLPLPPSPSLSVTLKFIPAFCRHSANGRRTDLHSTAVHVQCPLLSTQPSLRPSIPPSIQAVNTCMQVDGVVEECKDWVAEFNH